MHESTSFTFEIEVIVLKLPHANMRKKIWEEDTFAYMIRKYLGILYNNVSSSSVRKNDLLDLQTWKRRVECSHQ